MTIIACIVALLMSLNASTQTWTPTPLVINVPDWVMYDFDGSDVQITFDTEGKPAQVWLVIESKLDAEDKPVGLFNGYKAWHYVNGIDTTIYVSTSKTVSPGTGHVIEWNGYGNEKQFDVLQQNAELVPEGVYNYYIWGYDDVSARELVCDFITIGTYWEGQYARFYVNDDQGVPYPTPKLMGTQSYQFAYTLPGDDPRGDIFKWSLGNDPMNTELLEMSFVTEFDEQTEDGWIGYGPGVFDPQDHNTFYFIKKEYWATRYTPVKYTFVPDQAAEQDTDWGDWDNVEWFNPNSKAVDNIYTGLLAFEEDYLLMLDGGKNPLTYPHERFRIIDKVDPSLLYWNDQFTEFYMPEQPLQYGDSGEPRTSSEINRFNWGPGHDNVMVTGDMSCLMECINVSRLLDGADEAYSEDGDGWVTWANSNGDFFMDAGSIPDPEHEYLLWACIVSDPKNSNYPREETTDADMNGFVVSFIEFCGLNSFCVYCPDGTGIDQAKFGDDSYATGTPDETRKGGGELLDYGGTYDGLYMQSALAINPESGNVYSHTSQQYMKTNWIAFDSDSGIIGATLCKCIDMDDINNIEESSPETFTVIQNSPNPFNPATTITFSLAVDGPVSVVVRNVAGQTVDTLLDNFMAAGDHSVVWDASGFAAGTYFYTVTAGGYSRTMKMALVK